MAKCVKPAHKHQHAAETVSLQRRREIRTDSGRDLNNPSRTPRDDKKSRISQSSATPSARSGRVSSTLLRVPSPRGYQAVPPAAGYQLVGVQGKWQEERLPEAHEPQRNPPSANRYEELQRYGPEEEDNDIDVSDRSGISLGDMLHQEFEGLLPPYTELEENTVSPMAWDSCRGNPSRVSMRP